MISDVVDWEIGDRDFEQIRENLTAMVSNITFAKDCVPEPYVSWACNYCPFLRRCAEVGIG